MTKQSLLLLPNLGASTSTQITTQPSRTSSNSSRSPNSAPSPSMSTHSASLKPQRSRTGARTGRTTAPQTPSLGAIKKMDRVVARILVGEKGLEAGKKGRRRRADDVVYEMRESG
ncbi:hypothetical protein BJ742DRAFT_781327 [Cladochytrium replicatum]|nr:hypothetical protein BJ742DRAFT_781327 [Cladochytrium replicatum]